MSSVTGPPYVRNVTDAGLTVYWVTFGVMAGAAVLFCIITFLKPVAERSHGYVTILIVVCASCAYYAMATNGGQAAIGDYNDSTGQNYRSIYWARYVDWFITTPLLLLDLLLIAAVPFGTTLWIITADILMILTGLFGATSSHKTRWGWFGAGCLFQILLVWGMLVAGIPAARRRGATVAGSKISLVYTVLTIYLLMIWWGYPIVWGLAEGSNTITINAEVAAYAGLDIAAKVFFGIMVMAVYPILSKQNRAEYARGAYLPPLLSAPTNALLSPATVPLSEQKHHYDNPIASGSPHQAPVSDGAPMGGKTGNGTTMSAADHHPTAV